MKTSLLALCSLFFFHAAVAAAGADPVDKCVAAKITASAKRFVAMSKCRAKAVVAGIAVDPGCLQKAEDKFFAAFAKAEAHGPCPVTGDAAAIGDAVGTCNDTITEDLARRCGNGFVTSSETCDDGDATGGDGCSAACAIETGFACTGEPSVCASTCGDGVPANDESCDDGNQTNDDGCSASCAIEFGYACTGTPSACSGICGDGFIRGSETCDDGGTSGGDGCSSACILEGGWDCGGEPTACTCVIHTDLQPAEGFRLAQLLQLYAGFSYAGCGLPLQYFWTCQSDLDPETCPDFLAAANANGNTNPAAILDLLAGDTVTIDLTICFAGTSTCAPQIEHVYYGVAG